MLSDYDRYDAIGLAELIRTRQVTAIEMLEAAIARVESYNGSLNAVVTKMYDMARTRAGEPLGEGPLAGVPFLIKDLVAQVEGVPTSNGNKFWKTKVAQADSELVRRFKAAGLNIFGKTNTPEFGLTPYTESLTLGPARNPWDLERTPGGSSGGSAAAVAARIVPAASAGDGGGSIRIPASACGIFGLKPTRARTPLGPVLGEAWNGFAIEHVVTRSVRDSALLLDVTCGEDVGAPYWAPPRKGTFLVAAMRHPQPLKIAASVKSFLGKNVDPQVIAAYEESVKLLQDLGHHVEETQPIIDKEQFSLDLMTIIAAELRADIEMTAEAAGVKARYGDFDPQSFGLGLIGTALTATDYARASRRLFEAGRTIGQFFEHYDVLLTPVLARPPIRIGELAPSSAEKNMIRIMGAINGGWILKRIGLVRQLAEMTFEFMPWTAIFNVTGQPAMSVPLHWTAEGLPVGMHFASRFGDEATLFSLAGQLEKARPWADRKPPMAASL